MHEGMGREQIEQWYRDQGLTVEYVRDDAGKVYPPHAHHETRLYTLAGWAGISLEGGSWRTLSPGEECTVGPGVMHEAVVGPEGWEYLAAWNADEALPFRDITH